MTPLTKPVYRRTIGLHRGRRLIASLEPRDLVGVRLERHRQTEYLPVAAIYDWAVKSRVLAERAAKRKAEKKK